MKGIKTITIRGLQGQRKTPIKEKMLAVKMM
jgi:hypothetical protein